MSYPNYPSNRLIVNGTDLTTEFDLILADGYVLGPPSIKTHIVDIPGGNGSIDLTESLLGDTAYGNRLQEFTFYVINPSNFEQTKKSVSNFLHGKDFDYRITMDPDYTYHGRFNITGYEHETYEIGKVGIIKMEVDANPFKYLDDVTMRVYSLGGVVLDIQGGRKRVRPTIQTDTFLKIIFNNQLIRIPQGTWKVNDVLFTLGLNQIYFNSHDIRNLTWENLKDNNNTWGIFKGHRLFEWYKSDGAGTFVLVPWFTMENKTWSEISNVTWAQLPYTYNDVTDNSNVYLKYEVGDL